MSVFISEWHVLSVPLLLLSLKALFFSYYENLTLISFSIEILHLQIGRVEIFFSLIEDCFLFQNPDC